jgi:hypothetical protein
LIGSSVIARPPHLVTAGSGGGQAERAVVVAKITQQVLTGQQATLVELVAQHRSGGHVGRIDQRLASGPAAIMQRQHPACPAQYFPGTSLNIYTPDHLRAVEYEINKRPATSSETALPLNFSPRC